MCSACSSALPLNYFSTGNGVSSIGVIGLNPYTTSKGLFPVVPLESAPEMTYKLDISI
jgi:hypothetical protein